MASLFGSWLGNMVDCFLSINLQITTYGCSVVIYLLL